MKITFLAFAFVVAAFAAGAADRVLFDFAPGSADLKKIQPTDATFSPVRAGKGDGLRVATGHKSRWPGVALPLAPGKGDLTPYAAIELSVKNTSPAPVTVFCRADNSGADGKEHCVTGQATLEPGEAQALKVNLPHYSYDKLDGKLFGLRGYPVRAGSMLKFDPAKVTQLLIFVSRPAADCSFIISDARATGTYVPPTAWTSDADPFFPFIDRYGQYKHKDWPGKTHSTEEMRGRVAQEAADLAANPGPQGWDSYGGWAAGPQLKATGFFRTEKHQGKWWLVDPEGRLFFSHGVDCVGELDMTPVEERESWLEDFPGLHPEFAEFAARGTALKGYYAGRTIKCFRFGAANLFLKYGADWRKQYGELAQKRLRSWGLNTIANWSDSAIYRLRKTPYTDSIGGGRSRKIEGGEGYWSKFADVFDPAFESNVRASMDTRRDSARDPWCIGYFSDNELSWGDEVSLAVAVLRSPADQPAKKEFLGDLRKKYGAIEKLNEAWGAKYAGWDAMAASREAASPKPASVPTRYREDLRAFYDKIAERYFKTMRDAVKAGAPDHLYLGCRFMGGGNPAAAAVAVKYCDVVSYNIYKHGVDELRNAPADAPLIVGEFHFGALDRGMFHTGLVPVADQAARAQAYAGFVRSALRDPRFVGTAWFKYMDEPLTGRVLDEENYQIGFTDAADTPYPELVGASRAVAAELYATRLNGK